MCKLRIIMYAYLVFLTGCSAINSPFNNTSYASNNSVQVNQPADYQTTDDTPYAISQYLDDLIVARSNQSEEQSASEKYKRQN